MSSMKQLAAKPDPKVNLQIDVNALFGIKPKPASPTELINTNVNFLANHQPLDPKYLAKNNSRMEGVAKRYISKHPMGLLAETSPYLKSVFTWSAVKEETRGLLHALNSEHAKDKKVAAQIEGLRHKSFPDMVEAIPGIYKDIYRSSMVGFKKMLAEADGQLETGLWRSSKEDEIELRENFKASQAYMDKAITSLDAGDLEGAIKEYGYVLSVSSGHADWYGRAIRDSEDMKQFGRIGVTLAAAVLAGCTGGLSLAAMGVPAGAAAAEIPLGAMTASLAISGAAFTVAHRCTSSLVLNEPIFNKPTVSENIVDLTGDALMAGAAFGILRLFGILGEALPKATGEFAGVLNGTQRAGVELGGLTSLGMVSSIAHLIDPDNPKYQSLRDALSKEALFNNIAFLLGARFGGLMASSGKIMGVRVAEFGRDFIETVPPVVTGTIVVNFSYFLAVGLRYFVESNSPGLAEHFPDIIKVVTPDPEIYNVANIHAKWALRIVANTLLALPIFLGLNTYLPRRPEHRAKLRKFLRVDDFLATTSERYDAFKQTELANDLWNIYKVPLREIDSVMRDTFSKWDEAKQASPPLIREFLKGGIIGLTALLGKTYVEDLKALRRMTEFMKSKPFYRISHHSLGGLADHWPISVMTRFADGALYFVGEVTATTRGHIVSFGLDTSANMGTDIISAMIFIGGGGAIASKVLPAMILGTLVGYANTRITAHTKFKDILHKFVLRSTVNIPRSALFVAFCTTDAISLGATMLAVSAFGIGSMWYVNKLTGGLSVAEVSPEAQTHLNALRGTGRHTGEIDFSKFEILPPPDVMTALTAAMHDKRITVVVIDSKRELTGVNQETLGAGFSRIGSNSEVTVINVKPSAGNTENVAPNEAARVEILEQALKEAEKLNPDIIIMADHSLALIYPSTEFSTKHGKTAIMDVVTPTNRLMRERLRESPNSPLILLAMKSVLEAQVYQDALTSKGVRKNQIRGIAVNDLVGVINKGTYAEIKAAVGAMADKIVRIMEEKNLGGKRPVISLACSNLSAVKDLLRDALEAKGVSPRFMIDPIPEMVRGLLYFMPINAGTAESPFTVSMRQFGPIEVGQGIEPFSIELGMQSMKWDEPAPLGEQKPN